MHITHDCTCHEMHFWRKNPRLLLSQISVLHLICYITLDVVWIVYWVCKILTWIYLDLLNK